MSRLEQAINDRRFVITTELPAINSGGLAEVRARAAPLAAWADAINATDNTAAHAHASSLAVAIALLNLGVEPVMQLVCRDRNRLALQADIVGGALHGVENVLCLTGDDVTAGDEPEARRVFDLDGPQLLVTASTIAGGRFLSGREIGQPPYLFLGAVENPGAPPFEARVDRAQKKVRAGARFLQLQVCYRADLIEAFVGRAVDLELHQKAALIPSICLAGSPRSLRFMNDCVPGIEVPEALIEDCERAHDPAEACFELACELADHARSLEGVAGLHLIDFRRDDGVARLCQRLGIPSREQRETHADSSRVAV